MEDKKWKVRTKDGNIYGPADTGILGQWIRENRVSMDDDVSPADSEDWRKLSEIPEFATTPASEPKGEFLLPPAEPRTLTTQVVSDAWKTLKAGMWPIIGAFLLYAVIIIAVSSIPIPFIGQLAQIVIIGPLAVGLSWYCLCKIRKREIGVSALFEGFKIFLPALGMYLLIYIFTVLGMLFLIIPGIILSLAFSLSYFIIIDKNLGPWESMKASFDMTKGFRWRILAIGMLCSLINILGLLCLGVGILVTMPLNTLALAALYQRLNTGNIHESQRQTSGKEFLLGGILPAIAIIGIIAAIAIPAFMIARENARGQQNSVQEGSLYSEEQSSFE
jgi:uncharacterized membrane protein